MKRFLLTLAMVCVLAGMSAGNIYAEGVAINQKNFPDDLLRSTVAVNQWNRDGKLEKNEIKDVTKMKLNLVQELYSDSENNSVDMTKNYSVINCKGLEYFDNLKELYLSVSGIDAKEYRYRKRNLKNFHQVYRLKKIEKLTVLGDNTKKVWKFNQFPKLTTLKIGGGMTGTIRLGKNLKNLYIVGLEEADTLRSDDGLRGKSTLNLSKADKLRKFYAEGLYTNVKFGNNKNLRKINISNNGTEKNVKTKTLNFKGLKNVNSIEISGCNRVKNVKLGNHKKLKRISICSKALKEIDVKGCKALRIISVYRNTKVKNLGKGYHITKSKGTVTYQKK